jgi:hypothetical protein
MNEWMFSSAILYLALDGKKIVNFRIRPLYLWEDTLNPMDRVGPRAGLEAVERRITLLLAIEPCPSNQ